MNIFFNTNALNESSRVTIHLKEKPMKTPLWKPSKERIKHANITRFIEYVKEKEGEDFRAYAELYQWSVEKIPDFWARLWEFAGIKASRGYDRVVDDLKKFPGATWLGAG
jgi:acetoacetyl-CoA synthetase